MQTLRLIKAERLRRIIVSFFYLAAIFTLVYLAVNAQTSEELFRALFFLVLLPLGIYSEILRYFYAKAHDALNKNCDPERCLKILDSSEKADFLHQFQVMSCHLRARALIDLKRFHEAEEILNRQNNSRQTSKLKMDFEYNYLMFLIACAENDRKKLNTYYEIICRIFHLSKHRNADIRSLESMISGIYLYKAHRYPEAKRAFESVNINLLSAHEQAYYTYYHDALLHKKAKTEQVSS